jgi:GcrA cell cycle regulator
MANKKWTEDDRGQAAIQMRKELGFSNGQIAKKLSSNERGKITAGAVAGFLWRCKIAPPERPATNRKQSGWQTALAAKRKASPANSPSVRPVVFTQKTDEFKDINIADDLANPSPVKKTILTLTSSCCRWPIGDPQKPDFHFCGREAVPLMPYCEAHAQRAFQAVSPSVRPQGPAPEPAKLQLVKSA